jgi:hypothetical protein
MGDSSWFFFVDHKFVNWVLLFQDALTFWNTIALNGTINKLWHYNLMYHLQKSRLFCEVVVDVLSPIFNSCLLNQSCLHWVLPDALHFTRLSRYSRRTNIPKLFPTSLLRRISLSWVEKACGPHEVTNSRGPLTLSFLLAFF